MAKTAFLTGATGHVGSAVVEKAIAQGYTVRGLSRSEKGDAKLKALGAIPVRGDLQTLDILNKEASQADVVFHLADALLDFPNPREYDEVVKLDGAAVDAFASALKGTNKPLLVTSGTLVVKPDPQGKETSEDDDLEPAPFVDRHKSERYAYTKVNEGVHLIVMRLAPYVYGRGASGIAMMLDLASKNKQAIYIEDGHWLSSSVHVEDAADAYLLAAEKAAAGSIYNVTSATDIKIKSLAEAFGAALDVPAVSLTREGAEAKMGPLLSKFLTAECRASSAKAKRELGWTPTGPGLFDELKTGSYVPVANQMKAAA